jgi:hypothetical protein
VVCRAAQLWRRGRRADDRDPTAVGLQRHAARTIKAGEVACQAGPSGQWRMEAMTCGPSFN